ncbi:MAG: OmpA/MotB family protein, partial [Tepidisphaeraceae bacterium]
TLTGKAKEVITRFASILNSGSASGYELLVAGHTDNQRVVNPRTISAGHKDNWFLSAHRAISVAEALMSDRVSPQRIGVVGYAEQRPIASNGSETTRAQNRRVEVLILPTTVRGGPVATDTHPATPRNLNKDTANTDSKPVFNK